MFKCNDYTSEYQKVFIYLITTPNQVLDKENNPILNALIKSKMSNSIGLYFYRFKYLENYNAFSKIGEVSRLEGIEERFRRGWHGTTKYGDTYLTKNIYKDIQETSKENPMYFVFYEFDLINSFPKIDEQLAFKKHLDHFKRSTRNTEKPNSNFQLGINLAWHASAFDEVLYLKFPNGSSYPF